MATVSKLDIFINASSKGLTKGLKNARKDLNAFVGSTKSMVMGAGAAIGAGAAVAGLAGLTKSAMENADTVAAQAGLIGTSTKALSELSFAALKSDLDVEKLTSGLKKMNLNLVEAAKTGKGETFDALKEIGLDAKTLAAQDPADALTEIGEALSKVEGTAKQSAIAGDIFGKKIGPELLGFLNNGKAGLEEFRKKAIELGVSLDDVDAARINAANDAMDDIGQAMAGVGNQLAIGIAPFLTQLVEDFLGLGVTGKDSASIITTALDWIASGLGIVGDVLDVCRDMFYGLQAAAIDAVKGIVVGLNWLAGTIDEINAFLGIESDLKSFTETMVDSMEASSKEAWDKFDKNFTDKTPSEKITAWMDKVKAKSADMTAEVKKGGSALDEINEDMLAAADSAAKLIDKLQLEKETFGLSAEDAEIYKLAKEGVDAATLATIESLQTELGLMNAKKKKEDEVFEAAKATLEGLATPQQKYEAGLESLREQFNAGFLDFENFMKAQEKLKNSVFGEGQHTASAIDFNSSAAASLFADRANRNGGGSPMSKVAKEMKNQLIEAKKQTKHLDVIAKNFRNDVVVNIA